MSETSQSDDRMVTSEGMILIIDRLRLRKGFGEPQVPEMNVLAIDHSYRTLGFCVELVVFRQSLICYDLSFRSKNLRGG